MKRTKGLLTRELLSIRWHCSLRKIDRMRELGLLEWIDLSGGKGSRPTVRFSISSIEKYESSNLMSINNN